MSSSSVIRSGRRFVEQQMLDSGHPERPTGHSEYVDGEDIDVTEPIPGYPAATRCKVQTRDSLELREAQVGDRTSVETRTELHLPTSRPPLQVGDIWVLDAVHRLSLQVVGQKLRIEGPVSGSLKTARRYEVTEVVS